jgi:uncharacterized coiled-coil protein SlyX
MLGIACEGRVDALEDRIEELEFQIQALKGKTETILDQMTALYAHLGITISFRGEQYRFRHSNLDDQYNREARQAITDIIEALNDSGVARVNKFSRLVGEGRFDTEQIADQIRAILDHLGMEFVTVEEHFFKLVPRVGCDGEHKGE